MKTHTSTCDFGSLDEYTGSMEDKGWSVRQVLYVPAGAFTSQSFVVVFEREP